MHVVLRAGARGPRLELYPLEDRAAPMRSFDTDAVGWPERWSAHRVPTRVVVDLGLHGSLEIDDARAWQSALVAAGQRPSLAQRMQTRWPVLLAVLVLAVAGLGAFYRWGTPWAATQITRQVPLPWETALARQALQQMDQRLLRPSQLPPQRQAELQQRFAALVAHLDPSAMPYRGYTPALSLSFRRGLGANAFALPGGTMVMTDGLVQIAAAQGLGDDALVGVMAHEIGHVVHRHTTRMVVEQGVLNVGLGVALGDVSGLLSVGASVLTGLAYQRGHEVEADCFAVRLMARAGLPTAPMAHLLVEMERLEGKDLVPTGGLETLLATHPETAQRAQRLREGRVESCP